MAFISITCRLEFEKLNIHWISPYVYNHPQKTDQIFWGIGKAFSFQNGATHNVKTVTGMISNGWTRKDGKSGCGKEGIEICKHTAKYVIDMLFDCDGKKK